MFIEKYIIIYSLLKYNTSIRLRKFIIYDMTKIKSLHKIDVRIILFPTIYKNIVGLYTVQNGIDDSN